MQTSIDASRQDLDEDLGRTRHAARSIDRPLRVGLLGLGTVGGSVARVLDEHGELLAGRTGRRLTCVRALVRDVEKSRLIEVPAGFLTTRPEDILDDPSLDVVVEAIGGTQPAFDYARKALRSGKDVVTSNKALVAEFGPVLSEEAEDLGRRFLFEASVGGGIPLIGPLVNSLGANRITYMRGVLNGTSNFILDAMADEGWSYERSLEEARSRGYAEADPTDDVSGLDTARKMAILAGLASGRAVPLSDVSVIGIEDVSAEHVAQAVAKGYRPKLVAEARLDGRNGTSQPRLRVAPTLVGRDDPLAALRGPENGLWLEGWPVGSVFFRGPGAGGPATASAVVGDLLVLAGVR